MFKLKRAHHVMAKFATTQVSRHSDICECVQFIPLEGYGIVCSSSPTTLVVMSTELDGGEIPMLVSGAVCKAAFSCAMGGQGLVEVGADLTLYDEEQSPPEAVFRLTGRDVTVVTDVDEREYPDWRAAVPKNDPVCEVVLDARKLRDLLDAVPEMLAGSNTSPCVLGLYGPSRPIVVRSIGDRPRMLGVLMPRDSEVDEPYLQVRGELVPTDSDWERAKTTHAELAKKNQHVVPVDEDAS